LSAAVGIADRMLGEQTADIPRAIRRGRLIKRLTQQELADRAGLQRTTISELENGKHPPELRTLRALDDAFGQPVETFLRSA
jgi:transcriptional regulator with XRE-family HTH domain